MGGNRQIRNILWPAGTIVMEAWMGGVVERRSGESSTDVRPEIRGKGFRNRIMASCLNAP